MRTFISAGEASGDAYGAEIAREIRRLGASDLSFEGLGGGRMQDAGVELLADTGAWGAITFVHSLAAVPRVLRGYFAASRALARRPPGLFVPIDFGFVNIRLAAQAKRNGWKVLYFVPPGSWRRDRQGKDLAKLTDAISTPFPWSAELLRAAGADAHWFGHPLRQLLRNRLASQSMGERQGLAVLPGSRRHEIAENLPLIAEVVKRYDLGPVEFGLAPAVRIASFERLWKRLAPGRSGDQFTQGDTPGVLLRARAAIVCSGTATLEAALCHCPMVVVYRVGRLVELEAKIVGFKRPKFMALPNILLDRAAIPEFLQERATPEAVGEAVISLVSDPAARSSQLEAFTEIESLLGSDDAITKTAELAAGLLGRDQAGTLAP